MKKILIVALLLHVQIVHSTPSVLTDFARRVVKTTLAGFAGEAVREYVPKIPIYSTGDITSAYTYTSLRPNIAPRKVGPSRALFLPLPATGMAFSLNGNRTGIHEKAVAGLIAGISRVRILSVLSPLPAFSESSAIVQMLVHNFVTAVYTEAIYPPIINGMNWIIAKIRPTQSEQTERDHKGKLQ